MRIVALLCLPLLGVTTSQAITLRLTNTMTNPVVEIAPDPNPENK